MSISIISTSLTVPGEPSPRFHIEAWLLFRSCEMDYSVFIELENFDVWKNIVKKIR